MRSKVVPLSNQVLATKAAIKGLRINGRGLNQFRKCQVTFGKTVGSCEVLMEPGTRILAQASATIGEPMDSAPGEGVLTISAWISPSATGEMAGVGSQKPALIARALEVLFKEHRAIDLASLCIKFGEKAWILRLDVHILDMNGCLQEAAAVAALGALLTFQRAQAYVDKDTNELVVLSLEKSTPVKLHFFHHPTLTSFSLTPDGLLLAEPDEDEEEIFPGKMYIGINDGKEICYLSLTSPIHTDLIHQAMSAAQEKCLERISWIKQLAAVNDEERAVPVYAKRNLPRRDGAVLSLSKLASEGMSSLSISD